jgi:hypothetical protein
MLLTLAYSILLPNSAIVTFEIAAGLLKSFFLCWFRK